VSGKYQIIYADPPWAYRNYAYAETLTGERAKRGVVKEYPTMTMPQIAALPVESLAADDATLFMWATNPLLEEAFTARIMEAWGFTYKTVAFVWVKQNRAHDRQHPQLFFPTDKDALNAFWGMGNWTRQNVEVVLLGVRGNPRRMSADVHQVVFAPVMEHSRKPDEVRRRIVRLMGDLPRVELFARERAESWDVWGNEVESDVRLTA
jgi:N6-adenosine-specific RNA methylase IME4